MRNMRPEFWALEKLFLRAGKSLSREGLFWDMSHLLTCLALFTSQQTWQTICTKSICDLDLLTCDIYSNVEVFWRKKNAALWVLRWFPSSSISTRATSWWDRRAQISGIVDFCPKFIIGTRLIDKSTVKLAFMQWTHYWFSEFLNSILNSCLLQKSLTALIWVSCDFMDQIFTTTEHWQVERACIHH